MEPDSIPTAPPRNSRDRKISGPLRILNDSPSRKRETEVEAGIGLAAVIEAILLVSPEPVEIARLGELTGHRSAEVEEAIAELVDHYSTRGIRLQRSADRLTLVTAPEAGIAVARFLDSAQKARLSPAALETLAIIAYHQPTTRSQVEAIRGVSAERSLGTLLARGLIAEAGRAESVGRPTFFRTTDDFLSYFGLESLAGLPPLPDPVEPKCDPPSEI